MTAPRFFIYQHPTKAKFDHSPYYWWWEYVRRVPDYGLRHRLYGDFGDLGDEFYPWWREHGADLFAEQHMTPMRVQSDIEGEVPADSILLVVPALHPSMTVDVLVRRFRKAVKPYLGRGESTARYPIYGKPEVSGLKTTLAFYDLRIAEPSLTLYQIGERIHKDRSIHFVTDQVIAKGDSDGEVTDKKNVMAATVSRYIRHARGYIKNVADGVFPKKT